MMSYTFTPLQSIVIALLAHATCTTLIIKYYKQKKIIMAKQSPISIIKNSYTNLNSLLCNGVVAFILIYCLTTIVFYNMFAEYFLNINPIYKKFAVVSIISAYFMGIITQFIINPSDTQSIKFGITLSCISIIAILCLQSTFIGRLGSVIESLIKLKLKDILYFSCSFGFSYFVPSIFSAMSQKISRNHYSWLFGLFHAVDILVLFITSTFIYFILGEDRSNLILDASNTLIFLIIIILYKFLIKNQNMGKNQVRVSI